MPKTVVRYMASGSKAGGGPRIVVKLVYSDGSTVTYERGPAAADGTRELARTMSTEVP
jgi:hypothetical protein